MNRLKFSAPPIRTAGLGRVTAAEPDQDIAHVRIYHALAMSSRSATCRLVQPRRLAPLPSTFGDRFLAAAVEAGIELRSDRREQSG